MPKNQTCRGLSYCIDHIDLEISGSYGLLASVAMNLDRVPRKASGYVSLDIGVQRAWEEQWYSPLAVPPVSKEHRLADTKRS